jgi:hypothetical protein
MVKFFYMQNFALYNADDRPKNLGPRANFSDIFDIQYEHEFDIP